MGKGRGSTGRQGRGHVLGLRLWASLLKWVVLGLERAHLTGSSSRNFLCRETVCGVTGNLIPLVSFAKLVGR